MHRTRHAPVLYCGLCCPVHSSVMRGPSVDGGVGGCFVTLPLFLRLWTGVGKGVGAQRRASSVDYMLRDERSARRVGVAGETVWSSMLEDCL
jgi:hypothetical protein